MLAREDVQLRLNLRAGEALFVSNSISLHSRTEYQDGSGHKRHMLRVWMTTPAADAMA